MRDLWLGGGVKTSTVPSEALVGRGGAAAAPRGYSAVDKSRRRRGRDVDIAWTGRGGAAATTWIVRGEVSRRRRGRDVDIPW